MLTQGQIVNNRYRIVNTLAQGGFGVVYRAWDMNLSHPCALKENLETSQEAQEQFAREALFLSHLNHPNLPRVIDYFFVAGQGQYLVMDFVEGEDLQEKLEKAGGLLPEKQVLPWIHQVCDALAYMHRQNPPIIHRDIKPANIKINSDGKAMLVDFGISKAFSPGVKTAAAARAISMGFSPAEQYGRGITDVRSDIYALGATVYALLTGRSPTASVDRLAGIPLPEPRSLNPNIHPALEAAILKAMAMNPDERYQSANEFKSQLQTTTPAPPPVVQPPIQPAYSPPVQAAEPRPSQPPVQQGKKTRITGGLCCGGLALAALVAGLGVVILVATGVIPNPLAAPTARPPVNTSIPAATVTPVPTVSPAYGPFTMYIQPAGQDAVEPSSNFYYLADLTAEDDGEIYFPGHFTYEVSFSTSDTIAIQLGWCASSQAILNDNWNNIHYTLAIDGYSVDLGTQAAFFSRPSTSIGPCNIYRTFVSNWSNGYHAISYTLTMLADLNDGVGDYAAGDYVYDYAAIVR